MSELGMSDLPAVSCSFEEALEFAASYNAYHQIAGEPETLSAMYEPIRRVWQQTGEVPEWMGVDLLRGLLFLMFREDHFGYDEGSVMRQMHQVIEAIRSRLTEQHKEQLRLQRLRGD